MTQQTEFLVTDSKHVSRKDAEVTSLCVGDANVAAVSAARNIGVILDNKLSMVESH